MTTTYISSFLQFFFYFFTLLLFRPRSERCGPSAVILTPTRELALQIEKEINKYSFKGIRW